MSSVSLINGHIDETQFTDADVIRALEHCLYTNGVDILEDECKGCPFDEACGNDCDILMKQSLDLIKRRGAHIDNLSLDVHIITEERDALLDVVEMQKSEIEELTTKLNTLTEIISNHI